jgi:acetyl-CoA/propionyl-CoA carboxylase, biotin carboxylase, biotin carboxyl carrier protein
VFKKILIANRGEIAVRVMRTCRELGIATVAVYSEPDRDAAHVRYADEAYGLGGHVAAASYLNVAALLEVIARCGADAVHPGYGFLAESAAFAQAVAEQGVVFVGPPAAAIETMGDKISARRAAEAAGVVSVPGTREPLRSAAEVAAFGATHGWPVAVKAAFGGGGRGMKVIRSAAEAEAAVESARREAVAAFGRAELYVERFLARPRHIEMQLVADAFGNVVWLGERDCSVQRRHQKLVEESPAPAFSAEVRRAMGEASVRLARGCGYLGVGTVEFLVEDESFYFLEMNTRLQVEHPVTELVTGLDLVELQLRVASGEPLAFDQGGVATAGHAIEVRLNAEDPSGGRFTPSPGTLTTFVPPSGPGLRIDAGYAAGDTVSPYYDNLIAKIIAWAPDRDRARARMLRALDETEIGGVATTIPLQWMILDHPQFATALHSTNWVDDDLDLSGLDVSAPDPAPPPGGRPLPDLTAEIDGQRFTVKLWTSDPQGLATALGPPPPAPAAKISGWRSRRGVPSVSTWAPHGSPREASRPSAGQPRRDVAAAPGQVVAPMQGTVVRMLVSVGDSVAAGADVCVIEAMKMENLVTADVAGRVAEVVAVAGESVESGRLLVVIAE